MMMQIVHPWVIGIGSFLVISCVLYRWFWYRSVRYVTPYTHMVARLSSSASSVLSYKKCIFLARLLALIAIMVATAQLRMIDEKSKITIQGSDIILVLDVSGSMQLFDDVKDPRSRFDVAKQEVLHFIDGRPNDSIGFVVFGGKAVSRCPATLDKRLLHDIVSELKLGDIDHTSTVVGIAVSMAVNRLRTSPAASKIIILLTDGAPTENDIPIDPVIQLAKKYGIKIYTIGVGGDKGGYMPDMFGRLQLCQSPLNKELLMTIAKETNGAFFHAEKPGDIRRVYQTIDALEKTPYEAPLYTRYYDLFVPLIGAALMLLGCEIILRWWKVVV